MKTTPTTGGESTTAGGAVLPLAGYTDLAALAKNGEDGYPYEYLTPEPTTKRCTALTAHAPAQATIDSLRAEVERLTRERDELNDARNAAIELANSRHDALRAAQDDQARAVVAAGALMANTMFNLSQHPGRVLTDAECVTFKQMQVKWDAAIAATKCDALRSALMSNAAPKIAISEKRVDAAPEVDRAAERVETAAEFTHDPALCIRPACPATCSGCNHAISGQDARDYAIRYAWLRDRANFVREDAPQVVITDWSGSIISIQPSAYPQGAALDEAVDAAIRALADPLQGKETP